MTLTIRYMGQDLLNPPTVEGWHTGREWIDSGTLVERINFTADAVGNTGLPGVQAIINRLASEGATISAERPWSTAVWRCWAPMNWPRVPGRSWSPLANTEGELQTGLTPKSSVQRVGQMLQSIVATTEYLFA